MFCAPQVLQKALRLTHVSLADIVVANNMALLTEKLSTLGSFEKAYKTQAMTAKAMYVPRTPKIAMLAKLRKNCFFFTEMPA